MGGRRITENSHECCSFQQLEDTSTDINKEQTINFDEAATNENQHISLGGKCNDHLLPEELAENNNLDLSKGSDENTNMALHHSDINNESKAIAIDSPVNSKEDHTSQVYVKQDIIFPFPFLKVFLSNFPPFLHCFSRYPNLHKCVGYVFIFHCCPKKICSYVTSVGKGICITK